MQYITFNSSVQCLQNLSPIHLADNQVGFGGQVGKSLPLLAVTVGLLHNLQMSWSCLFLFLPFPGSPEEIKIPCVVFQVLSGSGSSSRLEE